jgi:hypothetical protein
MATTEGVGGMEIDEEMKMLFSVQRSISGWRFPRQCGKVQEGKGASDAAGTALRACIGAQYM